MEKKSSVVHETFSEEDASVAVIGGGSWATAIVKILTSNLSNVHWWVREPEIVEGIRKNGKNPLYLSVANIKSSSVSISNDLHEVVAKADYIFLVVPSVYIYSTLNVLDKNELIDKKVIIASKGIVSDTMQLITDFLMINFSVSSESLAVVSGPSHAEEIAQEKRTYLTVASQNDDLSDIVASFVKTEYTYLSKSKDILGIEIAVVLKNIYAIGAGIYVGLGYGDNFIAAYVANCANEMQMSINKILPGADIHLFKSVYLGDMLVTAYSPYSRNRTLGNMLGRGFSLSTAILELKMVAEGYYSTRCIYLKTSEKGLHLPPIVEAIYSVLYEQAPVRDTMEKLSLLFV